MSDKPVLYISSCHGGCLRAAYSEYNLKNVAIGDADLYKEIDTLPNYFGTGQAKLLDLQHTSRSSSLVNETEFPALK